MNEHIGLRAGLYVPKNNLRSILNRALNPRGRRFVVSLSAVIATLKEIPDYSFWQGRPNHDLMRTKTDAVVIRAGQNVWKDVQFDRNWAEAKRVGMKRATYWFYDDRASPGTQAALWLSMLQNDPPEMELWADWENSYGGPYSGLKNVVAFMEAMERGLPNCRIGMYTGYYWFRDHSNAVTNASQYNYLKAHPLWEAWYTSNPANVLIPAPWSNLLLWQFGTPAVGHEWGVESAELDMNYFNGSQADFDARYSGGTTPPPTGGNMQVIQGTVKGTVHVRIGPSNTYNQVSTDPKFLVPGDIIEASEAYNQWLKLSKVNGVAITDTRWASSGVSQAYIAWEWVAVDEPPPPPPPPAETREFIEQKTMIDPDGARWTGEAHFVLTKQL